MTSYLILSYNGGVLELVSPIHQKDLRVQSSTMVSLQSQNLLCQGEWNLNSLPKLSELLQHISWPTHGQLTIDGTAIVKMDTAGAWLLNSWKKTLTKKGLTLNFINFTPQQHTLIALVEKNEIKKNKIPDKTTLNWLARLGKSAWEQLLELKNYLNFVGKLTMEALRIGFNPARFRWQEIAGAIEKTGFQALFIIALLSFMIGVVLAYQMGLQLKNYGANIFIVDLLGISILREFGPLITAIMIAGRTGSAFTAQLGIMKINQEIDALNTIGVTPGELLILPRIIGLFIALPLLTIWADMFGILGGMIMSNNLLNIPWHDFLQRFEHEIPVKPLIIGLGKAPVFALIIASIGCFQGMQVEKSADSLGKNTTRSVVLGIFFIIIVDALFSIIFSKLKL